MSKDVDMDKLRAEFQEATELIDKGKLWDKAPSAVKYDGEFIKVVEIPVAKTMEAWQTVDLIVAKGYTIKGVVEREYWKTSLVILEYIRKSPSP
jgi:hypothetical protein